MNHHRVVLDPESFLTEVEHLTSRDDDLAQVVATHGIPEMWGRPPGLPALVLFILEQQVSLASGKAMFERVRDSLGVITPDAILTADEEKLRGLGVTRQKSGYLLELAERVVSGEFDIDRLEALDDDSARQQLLTLRGVGPWTAEVYLLSCLRRPDMWPVGDRALQVGTAEVLGVSDVPDPDDLEEIGERWQPWRAVAARLIWHNYLRSRGRVEPEVDGL